VDVTEPRRLIREGQARTGEGLSFTAFVLACTGRAVDEDRSVHAYKDWRNRLIVFDEVDVVITVEIGLGDEKFPLVHVVRGVDRRTVREMHDEIRAVQANPRISAGSRFIELFPRLPKAIRRLLYIVMEKNPHLRKRYGGTVGLTSVGMMFGRGGGWGLGAPSHTLAITLGGMAEKPAVIDGRIEVREFLDVTISFDHDIVDGAPAARFARRLVGLMEQGYGLGDGGRN
jgi:pyruvate/2-oxoglutarate dehydrogenase complex dihydrolipoamide acyltransferase (E2) component